MNSHRFRRTLRTFRLEQLEHRDAPATLASPAKLTYQDIDGDSVTLTFSKPILNAGNVDAVFGAGFVTGSNAAKQQMTQIVLTGIGAAATGVNIATVATASKLTGGDGFAALGHVDATGYDLGKVTVDGDLGSILAGDAVSTTSGLKALTVQSLGRYGTSTGAPNVSTSVQGSLDTLRVKTDVREASIHVPGAANRIGTIAISGSLIGGTGSSSGSIWGGEMGSVRIGGDIVGGSASQSGFIFAQRIGRLTLGGSLFAGPNVGVNSIDNGAIRVVKDIGTMLIKGNIIGNSTNRAIITSGGSAAPTATTNVAIGSLRVLGRVELARILAGYDSKTGAINADAQIGTVFVGGDWIASNLVAGAVAGANGLFGDADDSKITGPKEVAGIFSQIRSLTIGGQAMGTVGGVDHFGIVAENIGTVRIGGTTQRFNAGISNDNFAIGITGDFNVHEV